MSFPETSALSDTIKTSNMKRTSFKIKNSETYYFLLFNSIPFKPVIPNMIIRADKMYLFYKLRKHNKIKVILIFLTYHVHDIGEVSWAAAPFDTNAFSTHERNKSTFTIRVWIQSG